jgi:hypothetical protein
MGGKGKGGGGKGKGKGKGRAPREPSFEHLDGNTLVSNFFKLSLEPHPPAIKMYRLQVDGQVAGFDADDSRADNFKKREYLYRAFVRNAFGIDDLKAERMTLLLQKKQLSKVAEVAAAGAMQTEGEPAAAVAADSPNDTTAGTARAHIGEQIEALTEKIKARGKQERLFKEASHFDGNNIFTPDDSLHAEVDVEVAVAAGREYDLQGSDQPVEYERRGPLPEAFPLEEVAEQVRRRAGIKFGARQPGGGGGGYAAADAIRDELLEQHGVAIDDRAGTWSHAGPGAAPAGVVTRAHVPTGPTTGGLEPADAMTQMAALGDGSFVHHIVQHEQDHRMAVAMDESARVAAPAEPPGAKRKVAEALESANKRAGRTSTKGVKLLACDQVDWSLAILNSVVKKLQEQAGMARIGRSYFDKGQQGTNEPRLGINILRGYDATINQWRGAVAGSLAFLLKVDVVNKVFASQTCFETHFAEYSSTLRKLATKQLTPDQEDGAQRFFVGTKVYTAYNKMAYTVAKVRFDLKPTHTFKRKGVDVSFMEHVLNEYGERAIDPDQPMFECAKYRGVIPFIIPQLCITTEITNEARAKLPMLCAKQPAMLHEHVSEFAKKLMDNKEAKVRVSFVSDFSFFSALRTC